MTLHELIVSAPFYPEQDGNLISYDTIPVNPPDTGGLNVPFIAEVMTLWFRGGPCLLSLVLPLQRPYRWGYTKSMNVPLLEFAMGPC